MQRKYNVNMPVYVKLTNRYLDFNSAMDFTSLSEIIASCNPAKIPKIMMSQDRQTKRERKKKIYGRASRGKAYRAI